MTRAAQTPAWFDLPTVACKGRTSIMFDGSLRGDGTPQAKAVCNGCPHVDECRQYAHTHAIPYGVWGGEGPRSRWLTLKNQAAA
jgi:WhiB family redox-sensing transcriptional regulator